MRSVAEFEAQFNDKLKAAPCRVNCTDGPGLVEEPSLHGCPECWGRSKKWAVARLYGLHCFDLVVGSPGDSLLSR